VTGQDGVVVGQAQRCVERVRNATLLDVRHPGQTVCAGIDLINVTAVERCHDGVLDRD